MRINLYLLIVTAAVVWMGSAEAVRAQADAASRLERQLRQVEQDYILQVNRGLSLGERAQFGYGAEVNYAFMAIDDTDQATHLLHRIDARLFALVNIDQAHQFYGRLRFDYRHYNEDDGFTGDDYELEYPLSDRYWYRFNLREAIRAQEGRSISDNLTVQIGRQYVLWASGLTFTNELYAVRSWLELAGPQIELQGLVGYTPESSFYDIDSSRLSYNGDTQRFFFGGMLTYNGLRDHRPYVFYLGQRDNNDEDDGVLLVENPLPLPPDFIEFPFDTHYDSDYFGVGSTGDLIWPQLKYKAEFVYQIGSTLSSTLGVGVDPEDPQTEDDIEAWAARIELRWLFQDNNLSELIFETILASGDDDRFLDTTNTLGGNTAGTDDNAFNAFGYADTGLAFAAPVSNLMLFRIGAAANPLRNHLTFKNLRTGFNLFVINKMDADAPHNEATRDERYLGFESDVFVDWQLTSDVTLRFRYGIFFPGSGINGDRDPRNFLYTGVTYAF